jgi:electron transfer flavoprotein beta subunit
MGADRSIVLHLSSEAPLDPLATGLLLSGVVKEIGPDLIFCGERAVDDDAAQVGPIIAGLLDLPQICAVEQVVMDGMNLRARCRRGDVVEVRFSPLPCVVTFVRGRQLPRYPSLDDIFMADGKPQECRQVSHSEKENVLNRVSLAALAEDRGGEIISCESPNVAVELLLERIEQMTHIL